MFSLRSIANFLIHQFTFSIGGGLGEAALYGALFGGAKAAVTGEDVLKGALVGGVTGSAVNGIGDVFANGANNLSAIKTGDFVDAAGNSFDPLPANTVPDITPPAAVTNTAQEAENMGIANPNAPNMNQVTKVGGYTAGQPIQGNAVAGLGATPQAATGNPYAKLRDMVSAPEGSATAKGLNWAAENPALTSLGAGAAYGALTQKPPTVAQLQQEKSKLAGYNPNNFASYSPVSNVYSPSYAAEGGVMQSYAQGGIAALANGGLDGQSPMVTGMGQNTGYPQGMQDHTQYATPSQMPVSSTVVNADYEQKTDPYTGEPIPGMAQGGIAGYSLGGYAAGGNPRLLKGPGDGMSDNIPATIGGKQPARLADGEFVVPADVVSHLGNGSTDAGAKHLYNMMDQVRKARTGKKSQGKQIKPEKFLPA